MIYKGIDLEIVVRIIVPSAWEKLRKEEKEEYLRNNLDNPTVIVKLIKIKS